MGRTEFVALIAMMLASVAFSIDAMLPALPQIAAELSPEAPENAPLILSLFLLGMGLGTFFTGPLSDRFGRKSVILAASGLFIAGAAFAWASQSMEMILIARFIQGLGAAGPRVVSLAVVRDRFAGRQMAQIVSIVMMIFILVPAMAPLLGTLIINTAGWRSIFVAFAVFAATFSLWMMIRLPETLPPEARCALRFSVLLAAVREIAAHRTVRLSIFVQVLVSGMLFLTLMLVQPIYDQIYARGDEFPFWFFFIALIAGTASLLNALLVVRFGMQRLIIVALAAQVCFSGLFVLYDLSSGPYGFHFFLLWQTCVFFQSGLTIGNLNALAMEPMGHIAGTAASVIGALSTVGAVALSGPLGTMFRGDERLLIVSVLAMACAGFAAMLVMVRGPQRGAA